MRTIYKYPLELVDHQAVVMPAGARVLAVQHQPVTNLVCLWALVDTAFTAVGREVYVVGTGQPSFPAGVDGAEYAGTFQLDGGRLVFHVFVGG